MKILKNFFNYNHNNWFEHKKECYIYNIISNLFFLIPLLVTNNPKKKFFYFLTFVFSNIFHLDLCKDGNCNILLYILDILFIIPHLFFKENIKIFLSGNIIILLLLFLSLYYYFKGLSGWRNKNPHKYHKYHGLWHIFSSFILTFIELNNV